MKDKSKGVENKKICTLLYLLYGRASPLPDYYFFFRCLFALTVPLYSLRSNKRRLHLNATTPFVRHFTERLVYPKDDGHNRLCSNLFSEEY